MVGPKTDGPKALRLNAVSSGFSNPFSKYVVLLRIIFDSQAASDVFLKVIGDLLVSVDTQ